MTIGNRRMGLTPLMNLRIVFAIMFFSSSCPIPPPRKESFLRQLTFDFWWSMGGPPKVFKGLVSIRLLKVLKGLKVLKLLKVLKGMEHSGMSVSR